LDVDPYRTLGHGYTGVRRPDPRIAGRLHALLGDAGSVVNVGAGAGAYEPSDRQVLAVEPSETMLRQRPPGAAPAVQAFAENLPCHDGQFDAALALLTVHHWRDPMAGLAELRRVSAKQIVLTWDVEVMARMWLIAGYLPQVAERERGLATVESVAAGLSGHGREVDVQVLEIPWDCTDGFLAAYWRRPESYLDERVRAGMSGVAALPEVVVRPGLERLARDLDSGDWHRRHAGLLDRESLDVGYRLVVAS
jgi:SAM-dependent methyltransferase